MKAGPLTWRTLRRNNWRGSFFASTAAACATICAFSAQRERAAVATVVRGRVNHYRNLPIFAGDSVWFSLNKRVVSMQTAHDGRPASYIMHPLSGRNAAGPADSRRVRLAAAWHRPVT